MSITRRVALVSRRDDGVAVMTTLLVGAVTTALALVAVDVSLTNLRNAGRDRVGGSALGSAEAGLAQAVSYLRANGPGPLSCSPTCTANSWGNSSSPQLLSFADGGQARVWIQPVQPFSPPAVKIGTYRVYADGTSGQGPGRRKLEQTVLIEPLNLPMGVYAQNISLGGNPQTFQQSVFTDGCITGREKMTFSGNDIYYGGLSGANSAQYISTKTGTCSPTNARNVHITSSTPDGGTLSNSVCPKSNFTDYTPYWNDRDLQGGNLSSTLCYSTSIPRTNSYFDLAMLQELGQVVPDEVLAMLRTQARSIGQYWTSTTWTPPDPAVYPHAVIYFKLPANQKLTISTQLTPYQSDGTTCTPNRSAIIVVEHAAVGSGILELQASTVFSGAILVPKGDFQYTGSGTLTGPINARTISYWAGGAKSRLTTCYLQNMPGGLLDVRTEKFRENDSPTP